MNHKIILIAFLCSCATYICGMELFTTTRGQPKKNEQQALPVKEISIGRSECPPYCFEVKIKDIKNHVFGREFHKTIDKTIIQNLSEALQPKKLTIRSMTGFQDGIPNNIYLFTNLTKLYFSGNHLETLASILKLRKLRILLLPCNGLKQLPNEIGKLTNLTYLDVSGNKLKTLPASLCQLKNLEVLDVSVNNLETVSPSICKLPKLRKLFLDHNNKLRNLPVCFLRIMKKTKY